MTMTRRGFAGLIGKAGATMAVLATLPAATACFLSSVYKDLLAYAPVALAAFQSILSILSANGISTDSTVIGATIMLVKTGIADLQTAVTQYQDAPQGQKSTLLGAISEALVVVEANLNQFWNSLTIPDPKLETLIEGLLGVISTTLAGFATQLPPAATPKAAKFKAMTAKQPKVLSNVPTKRSLSQFKKDFNAQLAANGESTHSI